MNTLNNVDIEPIYGCKIEMETTNGNSIVSSRIIYIVNISIDDVISNYKSNLHNLVRSSNELRVLTGSKLCDRIRLTSVRIDSTYSFGEMINNIIITNIDRINDFVIKRNKIIDVNNKKCKTKSDKVEKLNKVNTFDYMISLDDIEINVDDKGITIR